MSSWNCVPEALVSCMVVVIMQSGSWGSEPTSQAPSFKAGGVYQFSTVCSAPGANQRLNWPPSGESHIRSSPP